MTKRVTALAWADEPLDFSDFFPPQAIEESPAVPALDEGDDAELLSLPHAVRAATATTDAVPTNALPKLVRSTVTTFRLKTRVGGNVCARGGRFRDGRLTGGEQVPGQRGA